MIVWQSFPEQYLIYKLELLVLWKKARLAKRLSSSEMKLSTRTHIFDEAVSLNPNAPEKDMNQTVLHTQQRGNIWEEWFL